MPEGIDWADGDAAAIGHAGYLATITAATESAFASDLVGVESDQNPIPLPDAALLRALGWAYSGLELWRRRRHLATA